MSARVVVADRAALDRLIVLWPNSDRA